MVVILLSQIFIKIEKMFPSQNYAFSKKKTSKTMLFEDISSKMTLMFVMAFQNYF